MVALQPSDLDPARAELAALEIQVDERERAVEALKIELQDLQSRYLADVGALYAELSTLEAAVVDEEIRAGVRVPPVVPDVEDEADRAGGGAAPFCASRSAPSTDLKRIFRDVAKAIHPDLADDEPARCRRHSLMAEANRAYAERDEDRLRLILRVWERSPDAIVGDDPEATRLRLERRLAELGDRLIALDAELADLRGSAIARLKRKIDEAKAQGWDLFAEMIRQVKREIATANGRLASLRRSTRPGAPSAAAPR